MPCLEWWQHDLRQFSLSWVIFAEDSPFFPRDNGLFIRFPIFRKFLKFFPRTLSLGIGRLWWCKAQAANSRSPLSKTGEIMLRHDQIGEELSCVKCVYMCRDCIELWKGIETLGGLRVKRFFERYITTSLIWPRYRQILFTTVPLWTRPWPFFCQQR